MRHHRRHRAHRHHRPKPFWIVQGVHRRVFAWLALAMVAGLVAGALAAGWAHGHHDPPLGLFAGVGLASLFVLWGLAWMATWRILGPMRRLARVAGELHEGRLDARSDLPEGDADVAEVSTALRGMADKLSRQLEEQRALMAAVSHELRSPLARARVLVEMSREGSAPATFGDDLEEEIEQMDRIVGDLLAASRIELEAVQRRPLDPADIALRALETAGLDAALLDADAELPELIADPTLLGRALGVLLDNARLHGSHAIALVVRDVGGAVVFEVQDDGEGFAPGDEERAFEPFWRGEGRTAQGTGLGLALVRRIAEAHGGSAYARNRQQGGARVALRIPV